MRTNIVFTFIGDDQPGLVKRVSQAVTDHDGNWLDSRLSRLAGKFAGIIHVGIATDKAAGLTQALEALRSEGLSVLVESCASGSVDPASSVLQLHVLGLDRRGIVHEIAQALAERQINVAEMATETSPAPMTGELLFEGEIIIEVPQGVDQDDLQDQLDAIGLQLAVDIELLD